MGNDNALLRTFDEAFRVQKIECGNEKPSNGLVVDIIFDNGFMLRYYKNESQHPSAAYAFYGLTLYDENRQPVADAYNVRQKNSITSAGAWGEISMLLAYKKVADRLFFHKGEYKPEENLKIHDIPDPEHSFPWAKLYDFMSYFEKMKINDFHDSLHSPIKYQSTDVIHTFEL